MTVWGTVAASAVGVRLPANHLYNRPGGPCVVSGGLSVDALGYLIGTSDQPFDDGVSKPIGNNDSGKVAGKYYLSASQAGKQHAENEAQGMRSRFKGLCSPESSAPEIRPPPCNVLRAEVASAPVADRPKVRRFRPPKAWAGPVQQVLNRFQGAKLESERDFGMSMFSAPDPEDLMKAQAKPEKSPQADTKGNLPLSQMLAKDLTLPLDPEVASHCRDPQSTQFKGNTDPQFSAATDQSAAEELGAPSGPTETSVNSNREVTLQRPDRMLGAAPAVPPSPRRNLKRLKHSPSKADSAASTNLSSSQRGLAPIISAVKKSSNTPMSKNTLQFALKLSVWQSESSSSRRMCGEDLQQRMNVAASEADDLLQGKSTIRDVELRQHLNNSSPGEEDDLKTGLRCDKNQARCHDEDAKDKSSHGARTPTKTLDRPPINRKSWLRKRTSFEEWLRRQELESHLQSLDVGGSGRSLDGTLWRLPESGRDSVKSEPDDVEGKKGTGEWVTTKVHFDLQSGRLQWEGEESGADRWKHWHVSDMHHSVEVEVKPPVKSKKRILYAFQLVRVQAGKKRETLVLATDTSEDRDRWVEALKRRASFGLKS